MAHKYVKVDYDKFENTTVTQMKKPYRLTKILNAGGLYHLVLRHVSAPDGDTLCIDVYYQGMDWAELSEGSLILRINNAENIALEPNVTGSDVMEVEEQNIYAETAYYEIDKEILKKICDAETVDIKVAGGNLEKVKEANQFIEYARQFYSELYNDNTYITNSSKGGCLGAIMLAVGLVSSLAACFAFVINIL